MQTINVIRYPHADFGSGSGTHVLKPKWVKARAKNCDF